jgi:hypothetical protein
VRGLRGDAAWAAVTPALIASSSAGATVPGSNGAPAAMPIFAKRSNIRASLAGVSHSGSRKFSQRMNSAERASSFGVVGFGNSIAALRRARARRCIGSGVRDGTGLRARGSPGRRRDARAGSA